MQKADGLRRGRARVGASGLPGIEDANLHEVGCAIASNIGQSDLQQLFGLNPRGMPAWLPLLVNICQPNLKCNLLFA